MDIKLGAELVNRLNVIVEGKAIDQIQGRVDRLQSGCTQLGSFQSLEIRCLRLLILTPTLSRVLTQQT